jgi:putative membrane protein
MPDIRLSYPAVVSTLSLLFLLEFVLLGIDPVDRATWVLENSLVVALAALLIGTYRSFRFSRVSYTMIFLFLALHEVGAHYTYSQVPYDALFERVFGTGLNAALGWDRNDFDRIGHFAYGLLMVYPMREVFLRIVDVRGFWGYALPLDLTMSTSMIYELVEWGAALVFGGETGVAFLGTQGDPWDAQWDMLLAVVGAVIAMGVTVAVNLLLQRDFAAEWADSFRVKHAEPLGEDAIARMLEDD